MSGPPTNPVARSTAAHQVVDGHHLHWQPWAPPVLLDPRAEAIRRALDGAPLDDLIDALAEVEHRPTDRVRSELVQVVGHLDRYGLLESSPPWQWWSPAALHRPVTACDTEAWNLDRADVFDLELAGRRITVAVDDPAVAGALRSWDGHRVFDRPADLGTAPIEVILATADRPGGIHRLFGRAGRTMARSTDRREIVGALVTHLAALEWLSAPGAPPMDADRSTEADGTYGTDGADGTDGVDRAEVAGGPVWFDATALLLPDGGVALLAGRARYDWARLARPLAAAGIVPVPGPAVALDPDTGQVVPPPPPGHDLVDLARRCGVAALPDEPRRPKQTALDLTVVRVDHVATPHELEQLVHQGHDPDRLDPALAAHRLGLLAHVAALDRFPDAPPGQDDATHILATVTRLATAPTVRSRLHDRTAGLVASLRGS